MDKKQLTSLVDQNKSTRQIAAITGSSQTNIRYWLKKFGLKTSPKTPHRCFSCGETNPEKFYGRKHTVCGDCHNEDTKRRNREKRAIAIDQLGGKCQHCGYQEYVCSLDIHHLDPSKKDPNFQSHRGWSRERILKELQGCVLLCKNCHTVVHNNEIHLDVG